MTEKPTSAANVLRVIGKLIEIGRERLRAIRAQLSPEETHNLACAFGTFNAAVILARIMRGLRLAGALEERVIATAARINGPPAQRQAA